VRRAQAVVRLATAMALGRAIAQSPADTQTVEREGQLAVEDGWIRRRRVMLSAAPTTETIERALAEGAIAPRTRGWLETLRSALHVFRSAAYGKPGELDTGALDRALRESTDAIRQLRLRSVVPFGGTARTAPDVASLGSPSISGDRA
jgi:hypothetical protein